MERVQVIESKAKEHANNVCNTCHTVNGVSHMKCFKKGGDLACSRWSQAYESYISGYKDCLAFIKSSNKT